jgi:hypothetical protein
MLKKNKGVWGLRKRCQILSERVATIFLNVVFAIWLIYNIFCPYCTLTLICLSFLFSGEQDDQGVWGSAEALPNFERASYYDYFELCFWQSFNLSTKFLPLSYVNVFFYCIISFFT